MSEALIRLLQAIGELLRYLAILALTILAVAIKLAGQMVNFLAQIFEVLARLAIVAGLVLSTLYAASMTYTAYGADLPALLPAALLAIAMCGVALSRMSWGALLAAGLAVYAIGTVIPYANILMRSLIIAGALATTIAHNQFQRESENHANQEIEQHFHHVDQGRPDLLYDDPHG